MVKPGPLLKGFGALASRGVGMLQDSTSKSVRPSVGVDIEDGEIVSVTVTGGTGLAVAPIGRVPDGAILLGQNNPLTTSRCSWSIDGSDLTVKSSPDDTFSFWVF